VRSVAGEILDNVGELAPPVVAFTGIPLRILVGEDRTHRLKYSFADKILGSNQFKTLMLTTYFVIDRGGYLRINLIERTIHWIVFHHRSPSITLQKFV